MGVDTGVAAVVGARVAAPGVTLKVFGAFQSGWSNFKRSLKACAEEVSPVLVKHQEAI